MQEGELGKRVPSMPPCNSSKMFEDSTDQLVSSP